MKTGIVVSELVAAFREQDKYQVQEIEQRILNICTKTICYYIFTFTHNKKVNKQTYFGEKDSGFVVVCHELVKSWQFLLLW